MKNSSTVKHESYPDAFHDTYSRTVLGFWLYLMTDFVLFGALFATYAVLSGGPYGGTTQRELLHFPFTLAQSLIFLTSSLTVGLAGASAHRRHKHRTILFFGLTFVLGVIFLGMEIAEFARLIHSGNSWDKNAFLSAFFTVVGTHFVHVVFGLLWIIILLVPVWREGVTDVSLRRLTCLRMFWQFLNIIWVFIFSYVYLMGVG